MKNALILALFAFAAPLALAGEDHTHDGDIALTVRHGRIITGVGEGPEFRRAQVFGAELGAEGFPNTTDEPGFDNPPMTFAPGSSVRFDILGPLLQWDGAGLSNPAGGEIMEIALGPVAVATGAGFVPGFALPVSDEGDWHEHYEYTLLAGDRAVSDGVYVLHMRLSSDDPSLRRSIPFWIVFNQNADDAIHDEVIDWVGAHVVPSPGGAALLALAGLGALRRRR